jgi:membrane fusion protein (multidrug efflux system)
MLGERPEVNMVRNTLWLLLLLILCYFAVISAGCTPNAASEEKVETVTAEPPMVKPPKDATEWKKDTSAERQSVRIISLAARPHTFSIEVSGKTLAVRESVLSLGVSGLIKQIPVTLGDEVRKGQVLLKLDQKGFLLNVRQAEAGLKGAKATLDQLAVEITRVEKLLKENAAPSATLDDLTSQHKGASAKVEMAETSLEQALKSLKDSVLRAPYDGVITEIYKEEGEQAPTMPSTMLMKIVDTSSLEVQVFVPEDASPFVRLGGSAEVTVDSAGVTTTGKIVFVSNSISSGARSFETRVRIENNNSSIKSGAFARVRFEREKTDAVLIPISSIKRDSENQSFVFVSNNGIAEKRNVTLGATDGAEVIVMNGLKEKENLIVSETSGISSGQTVDVEK